MDLDDGSNHGDFLRKLYEMVDDPSTDSIVSWSQSGKSFIVWNESEFSRDVLPRCLLYKKMSSFTHRLVILGFKKVESEQWEYANCKYLVRGQPELTKRESLLTPQVKREMQRMAKQLMAYRADRLELEEGSNHGDSSSSRPYPSFLVKLYEMVDDPSMDSIVSWSESGKSFIIWNETEFCRDVLPRFLQINEMFIHLPA